MKTHKTILLIVVLAVIAAILPARIGQAADWYTCKVNEAGPTGTKAVVKIYLTDLGDTPAFDENTAFSAQTGREKEMLAVAMAAMSNAVQVRAQLDVKKKKILTLNVTTTANP